MAVKINTITINKEDAKELAKRLSNEFKKQFEEFQNGDWNMLKPKNASSRLGESITYFFKFPKSEKQNKDEQGIHGFIKSVAFGVNIFLVNKRNKKEDRYYEELLFPESFEVLVITNFPRAIRMIAEALTERTPIKIINRPTKKKKLSNTTDTSTEPNRTYNEPPEHTERRARIAKVWNRPNQKNFSNMIRAEYKGTCIITGCTTQAALEAAHIIPFADGGADTLENGLLLRADLHLLFDANLMAIDPATSKVHFKNTGEHYNKYDQKIVDISKASRKNLTAHWQKFQTT